MIWTIGLTLTGLMRCTCSLGCLCRSIQIQVDLNEDDDLGPSLYHDHQYHRYRHDIESRHGLPKTELQQYWANASLYQVITITDISSTTIVMNIITIIIIIITVTIIIMITNRIVQYDQNVSFSRVISGFTKFKQKLDLKALPQVNKTGD